MLRIVFKKMFHRRKASSLIEIIIIISIVGVLCLAYSNTLMNLIEKSRTAADTQQAALIKAAVVNHLLESGSGPDAVNGDLADTALREVLETRPQQKNMRSWDIRINEATGEISVTASSQRENTVSILP